MVGCHDRRIVIVRLRMVCAALAIVAGIPGPRALAQTTTATITGRVVDSQGLGIAGAAVRVSSPALQGVRSVVTSASGDFVVALLPPGTYIVAASRTGFTVETEVVPLGTSQTISMTMALSIGKLAETVDVTETSSNVFTRTVQSAVTFRQSLLSTLPTNRDIFAALLLAANVHPTGPLGAYTIAGAMSSESLFTIDGATISDNIRGQPLSLYVEDAIQEVTIASTGVSAEYGRFSGGVAMVTTKSGGNRFGGSFRTSLANDQWRALSPAPGDQNVDLVLPTYEATLGGPIQKDRLWFFAAAKANNPEGERVLPVTNFRAPTKDHIRKYEGNLRFRVTPSHAVQATYGATRQSQHNQIFSQAMDLNSLYDRDIDHDLVSMRYLGSLSPRLFVEAQYSFRHFTIAHDGATTQDLIGGTLIIDRLRGRRYWSPTFCGICDSDRRNNDDAFVKVSYFVPTEHSGSHYMVFGYDAFNDVRRFNNYQSGSSYRILGTTSIIQGADIYPVFLNDGSTLIEYDPISKQSQGTAFRTHSLFYNDTWSLGPRTTVSLGARWDKNHGRDSAGTLVATAGRVSPRLGVVWDPSGAGTWSVTGSVARYTAALAGNIADTASDAGRSATYLWTYGGPSINAAGPIVRPDAALQQVFAWFNANGGSSLPLVTAILPSVSVQIPSGLASPSVFEYAAGVGRTFGHRGSIRLDVALRRFQDFYASRIDTSTGIVADATGTRFDLTVVENTNALSRRYAGLTLSATYRPTSVLDLGGNYTLSEASGNFEGEDSNGPFSTGLALAYPEYRGDVWTRPDGDLLLDQRHRANLWATYLVPRVPGLTIGSIGRFASGLPYGAVGLIDARPFVTNPGYVTPQGGSSQRYYYTARDAFHTETTSRIDLAVNYSHPVGAGAMRPTLFGQAQILNLFNWFSVVVPDATVQDSVVARSRFQPFNPFTTSPVEGVNWARNATFGLPFGVGSYNAGRTFLVSFGARF